MLIVIILDRDRIARYGMNIRDIQNTIEAAVGGITLGQIYEEQKRFDIFLRFEPEYCKDIEQIEGLLIRLPNGGQVPLAKGPGAEIWRPLATVVVGGLITSTLVTLIVLPLIFQTLKKEKIR